MTWQYYAVFNPPERTRDNPSGLIRLRPGDKLVQATSLRRDATWQFDDTMIGQHFGHDLDVSVEPIDEDHAARVVKDWVNRGVISEAPSDGPASKS